MITEVYVDDDDRIFWPDTIVGSELDYCVDWSLWLENENDEFVSMTWNDLPTGLSSSFNANSSGVSTIRISADLAGTYCISGVMVSSESGHQQSLVVKMNLIVENICQ